MKKPLLLLLAALLCLSLCACGAGGGNAAGQGWKLDYFLDEFKEPTDNAYLTNSKPFSGIYNTAELSDKPLEARLLADEYAVYIELIPQGGEAIKFSKSSDFRMSIKTEDGKVFDSIIH